MNNSQSIVDFGQIVRNAQKCTYIRQVDIARALNVRPQAIGRWLNSKDIKLSTAMKIAAVFEMDIGEFVKRYSKADAKAGWDYKHE